VSSRGGGRRSSTDSGVSPEEPRQAGMRSRSGASANAAAEGRRRGRRESAFMDRERRTAAAAPPGKACAGRNPPQGPFRGASRLTASAWGARARVSPPKRTRARGRADIEGGNRRRGRKEGRPSATKEPVTWPGGRPPTRAIDPTSGPCPSAEAGSHRAVRARRFPCSASEPPRSRRRPSSLARLGLGPFFGRLLRASRPAPPFPHPAWVQSARTPSRALSPNPERVVLP
jgi:hypothetical protein